LTIAAASLVSTMAGIAWREAHKRRRTAKAANNEKIRKGMEDGDINADQAGSLAVADIDEDERDRLTDEARNEAADRTREKAKDAEREAARKRGEDPAARHRKRRSATKFVDSDGMWNLRLTLDPETGTRVEARIGAANKAMWHQEKVRIGPESHRTPQQRLADTAAHVILDGSRSDVAAQLGWPGRARSVPDLTVAIAFDWLSGQVADRSDLTTNSGIPITPATVRRLACEANIIPVVLDAKGEVLDLGRAVRTVTLAQRRALEVRDGGCVWPGCNAPPGDCDAHHVKHWAEGGSTDLDNLALACHTHHQVIHESGYQLWKRTGEPRFNIHESAGNP